LGSGAPGQAAASGAALVLRIGRGHVFIALSPDRYPIGVLGRRNALGELFVSRIVICPHDDFRAAVDEAKQKGIGPILGAEAEELFCRLERAKGIAPRTHKSKEICEVENWGEDEWFEQVLA
jgi:adenosine/AMP kinase